MVLVIRSREALDLKHRLRSPHTAALWHSPQQQASWIDQAAGSHEQQLTLRSAAALGLLSTRTAERTNLLLCLHCCRFALPESHGYVTVYIMVQLSKPCRYLPVRFCTGAACTCRFASCGTSIAAPLAGRFASDTRAPSPFNRRNWAPGVEASFCAAAVFWAVVRCERGCQRFELKFYQ